MLNIDHLEPSLIIQSFSFGQLKIELYVPDQEQIREKYQLEKSMDPFTPFPFWARIWPSAVAMAEFVQKHPEVIMGKKVLELAAGLGLPSLLAAKFAREVCCSDYQPEAVSILNKSVSYNGLENIHCCVLDWNELPHSLNADILMMSDVNYAPADFDTLTQVCEKFLNQGTTILLTTPGRIMGKSFVSRLEKWIRETQELTIQNEDPVYLYLLKQD